MNRQTLAVVGDFTNSAHGGAVVRVVVTLDGLKMASIAVFRIKFHLRTLEASETGENQQRLVGDRGTASTCYLDLILSTIVLEMRTTLSSAGDLLFGQTRGRVLALLYGVPDETFFVRQIARQVETSVGTVQRELALLADAGLIKRSAVGSQVFYQANQEHPEFPELRALLAKTTGVFQMLKAALAPLSSRISVAFVYGSVARGEEKAASDIDLMVIGAITLDEVLDAVVPVEKQLRRPVNPTIYSLDDVRARLREGNHFLQSLKKSKKVFLIGDEDEFRKVSTTRLVQG